MNTCEKIECTAKLVTGDDIPQSRPEVLRNVIGQEEAKKKLGFLVAAHSEDTPFPTVLMSGSQGLGKTYMSAKVAEALGRDFIEINCGSMLTRKDFVEDVLMRQVAGNRQKTLLLDESHKLTSEITTILLSVLNPNESHTTTLNYRQGINLLYDFSKINIIFATTDAHMMFAPLLSRAKNIYFNLYSNDELFRMLDSYLNGIKLTRDDAVTTDIAYACRGRGRDTYMLAEDIRRYCHTVKSDVLDASGWVALRDILDIHPMGLYSQEVELMKVIGESGPISCRNLALRLGVNEHNINAELEVRPRELDLVTSCSRGRILTAKGEEYLRSI